MLQLPKDRIYVTKFNDPLFRDYTSEYLLNRGVPLISLNNYCELFDRLKYDSQHLGVVVCELKANSGETISGIDVDCPVEVFAYMMKTVRKKKVPVIATYHLGKGRSGVLERKLLASGASSVLTHPFSEEDLHTALLKVVGRKKEIRRVDRPKKDRKYYEDIVKQGFGL